MTVQDLIKKYDIYLEKKWDSREKKSKPTGRIGINYGTDAKKDGVLDEIKALKQEIIDFLTAEETAKREAAEDRQRRIAEIEGLKEIIAAREAIAKYLYERRKAIENDGFGWPKKPDYDLEAAYKKYPKAAAYLKAESLANKSNYELSAIGRKAVEGILYGDWEKAIETMNAERSAFADRHAWD